MPTTTILDSSMYPSLHELSLDPNNENTFYEVIRDNSPYIYLHPDDDYHPESFESYLNKCELYHSTLPNPVLRLGEITPDNLTSMNIHSHPSATFDLSQPHRYSPYILKLDPEQRVCLPNLQNNATSTNPNGPANVKVGSKVDQTAPLYVFITQRSSQYTDVTYSMFTSYNASTACNGCLPIGIHDSDWERIVTRFTSTPDTDSPKHDYVSRIYLDQHGNGKWFEPKDLQFNEKHPLVYCAWRSHAMYPTPGIRWRFGGFGNDYRKRSTEHLWKPRNFQIIDTITNPTYNINNKVPKWLFYTGQIGAQGMNLPMWRSDWNNTANL